MHDIMLVQVVDGLKDLLDGLRSVFLSELAPLAYTVKQLSTGSKLSDNVIFVLDEIMVFPVSFRLGQT
jgi:hypothetical protein